MPRAKSDLTNAPNIGVRVTQEEYEVYKKLGGGPWLRAYLKDIADRRKEDAAANTFVPNATTGMVAVRQTGPTLIPQIRTVFRPLK